MTSNRELTHNANDPRRPLERSERLRLIMEVGQFRRPKSLMS